ncbi:MAG: GNAT family N-acetyltransferase [Bacteriovoracaceae bacterium]
MNITVKRASSLDLEWVSQADQYFPHPWTLKDWQQLNSDLYCFVAANAEGPVGYALFRHLPDDEQTHLLKIYILPHWRRKGVAELLFEGSLLALPVKEVFLEVGETNLAAQRFYEKIGFNKLHLSKGFYSDGENAWLMLLTR